MVQAVQHPLLFLRKIRNHAMQEQRSLVEQPFRRFDVFDYDAARQLVEPRILLDRQLAAGKDYDREVCRSGLSAQPLEYFEPGHIGKPQIENHAVERLRAYDLQSLRTR